MLVDDEKVLWSMFRMLIDDEKVLWSMFRMLIDDEKVLWSMFVRSLSAIRAPKEVQVLRMRPGEGRQGFSYKVLVGKSYEMCRSMRGGAGWLSAGWEGI